MRDTAALFWNFTANNDPQAFRQFYDHFFVILFRYTCTLLKDKALAEEITHDVFVHCWEKRQECKSVRNPQVFLFVLARNRAVDHLRRKNRNVPLETEHESEVQLTPDPEQLLITTEMMNRLEESVRELPPKCREVFILVKQYGLKYREVADIMQLSVKTVENQLAIALKKLTQAVSFRLKIDVARKTTG